ncbi:MAG: Ig-like domain-containing protein, partial [Gemmatimonadales bacterium]
MRQQRIRRWALGIAATVALAGACGGDDIDLPVPAAISVVDGTDGQLAFAGAPLPAPLTVLVTDAAGVPVPRGEVRWSVTGGAGAGLSDSVTQADASGQAIVWLTLGT